jgi:hypothetical protein
VVVVVVVVTAVAAAVAVPEITLGITVSVETLIALQQAPC